MYICVGIIERRMVLLKKRGGSWIYRRGLRDSFIHREGAVGKVMQVMVIDVVVGLGHNKATKEQQRP